MTVEKSICVGMRVCARVSVCLCAHVLRQAQALEYMRIRVCEGQWTALGIGLTFHLVWGRVSSYLALCHIQLTSLATLRDSLISLLSHQDSRCSLSHQALHGLWRLKCRPPFILVQQVFTQKLSLQPWTKSWKQGSVAHSHSQHVWEDTPWASLSLRSSGGYHTPPLFLSFGKLFCLSYGFYCHEDTPWPRQFLQRKIFN